MIPSQADAITDMIGFPDFILDPVKLDERYDGVSKVVFALNNIITAVVVSPAIAFDLSPVLLSLATVGI